MTTIRESNQRFGTVTLRGTVKAWHVYGLTTPHGEAICADCADSNGFDVDSDTECHPVFASDDYETLTCDRCNTRFGE